MNKSTIFVCFSAVGVIGALGYLGKTFIDARKSLALLNAMRYTADHYFSIARLYEGDNRGCIRDIEDLQLRIDDVPAVNWMVRSQRKKLSKRVEDFLTRNPPLKKE